MAAKRISKTSEGMDLPCICALIRKAGRVVTQHYDGFLKESGLRITQYSMLMNIQRHPDITVSNLSNVLRMDQTTVTRNLKVLERQGYAVLVPDEKDQRVRNITVTKKGQSMLKSTRSAWKSAQRHMARTLGPRSTEVLVESLQKLTAL